MLILVHGYRPTGWVSQFAGNGRRQIGRCQRSTVHPGRNGKLNHVDVDRAAQDPNTAYSVSGNMLPIGVPAMTIYPQDRLEINGHRLRTRRTEVIVAKGDVIVGARVRFWPAPWWWKLTFELADPTFARQHFMTQGIGPFLKGLASDPNWVLRRDGHSFTATAAGRHHP